MTNVYKSEVFEGARDAFVELIQDMVGVPVGRQKYHVRDDKEAHEILSSVIRDKGLDPSCETFGQHLADLRTRLGVPAKSVVEFEF